MAKNAVTDWDVTANNNTDIAGINIAEGCPAAGINDSIRTVMAQFAAWLVAATGPILKVGGFMANGQQITDGYGTARLVGYRAIPPVAKTATYTIALTDVGGSVSTTAGVTVPLNATVAFAIGDTIAVYNNSSSGIVITQTSGVTLRLAGTATTGNRTLAQRGLATLVAVGADEWVCSGMGVS